MTNKPILHFFMQDGTIEFKEYIGGEIAGKMINAGKEVFQKNLYKAKENNFLLHPHKIQLIFLHPLLQPVD